jgi:hypothetical protein
MVKTNVDSVVPPTSDKVDISSTRSYSAFVWAVHKTDSTPKRLWAVLAPKDQRGDLEGKWKVKGLHLMARVRAGEPIYICVPLSDREHLPLKDHTLW